MARDLALHGKERSTGLRHHGKAWEDNNQMFAALLARLQ